jgi:biotin carboxyl carrier protein
MTYEVAIAGIAHRLELKQDGSRWECTLDGERIDVDAVAVRPEVLSLIVGGRAYEIKRERTAIDTYIWVGVTRFAAAVRDPRSWRSRRAGNAGIEGPQKLHAPMPGKVVRVLAPPGTMVAAGQGVLVIEAMKMQNELKSPKAGVVKQIAVAEGSSVTAGEVLAVVE